ncbi:MAG: hypothetical protein WC657_01830 [Candidatus Paceibacterota bacterium]|jgi:hypothetical protein
MHYFLSAAFLPLLALVALAIFCLSGKSRCKPKSEYFNSFSIFENKSGQDMIEFAIMAGFLAAIALIIIVIWL